MKNVSFWRDMLVFSVFWCYAKHFSIQSRIKWQKYNKTKETLAMKTWEIIKLRSWRSVFRFQETLVFFKLWLTTLKIDPNFYSQKKRQMKVKNQGNGEDEFSLFCHWQNKCWQCTLLQSTDMLKPCVWYVEALHLFTLQLCVQFWMLCCDNAVRKLSLGTKTT